MNKHKIRNLLLFLIVPFAVLAIIDSRTFLTKYETPTDAYESEYDSSEYQLLEGKKTACILNEKEDLYVIKCGEKWRIPRINIYTPKYEKDGKSALVYVYEFNNLNDYYISILLKDKNAVVSDNVGSDFIRVNEDYYASCVTNPNENYVIYVNGEEHFIFK